MVETESSGFVPESVLDPVKRTVANLEQVEIHLLQFLSVCDRNSLAELPPLQRAQSLFLLAKATLRLRSSGIDPDDHPIKSELERLSLYQDKLERYLNMSKASLRPSTTLNYKAAARFIEHSLPDLTPEQRKSMKEISKGEGPKTKYLERSVQRKRKYPSSEATSVQTAAKEFLEKAARELIGDNAGGVKGPLQIISSDEDN